LNDANHYELVSAETVADDIIIGEGELVELFKLSTPDYAPEGCESLYYRVTNGSFDRNENYYSLSDGAVLATNTYFNIFSSSKYAEYTKAENITFTTCVSGKMDICLHVYTTGEDEVIKHVPVYSDVPIEVSLEFNIKGLSDREKVTCHYVSFESKGFSKIHEFGRYSTNVEQRDVRLAVVICTFRREEYVYRTVRALKNMIFDSSYNTKQTDIFIIDNGKTLTEDICSESFIHLIPNRNLGGSGGFTRGMIEALEQNATHVLLMDDDIILDPISVYKTLNLLKIAKDEYLDAFILGGMLNSDEPTIQHEAGSLYNGRFTKCKGDLDLLLPESLIQNDLFEEVDYGGWWYACMPTSVCDDNLPLPLFVKMDDIEYCLRNMDSHIIMNGVGVWHENFSKKQKKIGEHYYFERNSKIIKTLTELKSASSTRDFWHEVLYLVSLSDYVSLSLYLRAISDYTKGVDFLLETDEEELHAELQKIDVTDEAYHMSPGRLGAFAKLIFTKRFWKNLVRSSKVYLEYMKNCKRVSKEYRNRSNELMSTKMWKRRLNI